MKQVLPKTVGGTKGHLLLGIKNTRLQPALLKVLPSGVGVYLSPFTNVWGSRIMFAGPGKVFSKTNKEISKDSNHAVYSADANETQEQCNTSLETRGDRFNSIESRDGVNLQVDGTTVILGKGGFSLKFIVNSGAKPCEKASLDGEAVKMLGYKLTTEPDLLSPGLGGLNLFFNTFIFVKFVYNMFILSL